MRARHNQKVGRKALDDVGSGNSLQRALNAALAKRGLPKKSWRREIGKGFERSKHFGRKAFNE